MGSDQRRKETVTTVVHPLIAHALTILRDKTTSTDSFRRQARVVSTILLLHVLSRMSLAPKKITTPLTEYTGEVLDSKLIIVPLLRAGLAMLHALEDLLPGVAVGFIGLERDEQTAQARSYYKKLPTMFASHTVVIVDPMLATGGTFLDAIRTVKDKGAQDVVLVSIVSSPEGIAAIHKEYPTIPIVTAAIDAGLTPNKFITPGLGDFGDRYFGTE